ncbi:MAG: hypothetical protein JSU83_15715, partial [Deltaproteobacteria bacterium]
PSKTKIGDGHTIMRLCRMLLNDETHNCMTVPLSYNCMTVPLSYFLFLFPLTPTKIRALISASDLVENP